ncbi:MAG: DUF4255 domain-containing protein [Nitrolancea sp.]
MSGALAVAAVSAVLKDLLDNRVAQPDVASSVGDVTVTALPPDRIAVGADERNQLNLFLYRVTPRATLTRLDQAPGNGANGHAPRPLSLDLHYLLSAHGQQDFHAEVLLGCGIQVMHETPVLTAELLRTSLSSSSTRGGSGTKAALAASGIAERAEQITIAPEFLSTDETSRLWSALQARYRPSVTYRVSSIPIDLNDGP